MDAISFIAERYQLDLKQPSPIEIRNVGRATLATWLGELGFNRGVEIGTQVGIYAEILCKANPNLFLTCVDPWIRYADYRAPLKGEDLRANFDKARERLKPYNVETLRAYSMDAVKVFEDGELDFVYIDGNHEFEWVVNDIIQWSKKVRAGGIIAGHDFIRRKNIGFQYDVIAAVHGYTEAYRIHPWFILGTRAKVPGEIRDDCRSWMWVKA